MATKPKLHRVHVTPRDAIEVNLLASLAHRLECAHKAKHNRTFKVGQRCLFWVNVGTYTTDIDISGRQAGDYWSAETIPVNELAYHLQTP